jgi:hypothetical protein
MNQEKIQRLKSKTMIFSTSQQHLADLYLAKLKANNINSFILNKQDSMYNAFGNFELYVHQNDVIKAKRIIEDQIDE